MTNLRTLQMRLDELRATREQQIAYLVKDHTKRELANVIVAGRIHHAERDISDYIAEQVSA